MINGNLQAEVMETKHKGHIQRYGTPIIGNTADFVSSRLIIIIKYIEGYEIQLDSTCQVLFLHIKQDIL